MKENQVARDIVAMLLRRERAARKLRKRAIAGNYPLQARMQMWDQENEIHNAAELARRILHGVPL